MKAKPADPKGKEKRKTIVKSLSLPLRIINLGKNRAKAARRSFSNHVAILIEEDAVAAK